ncbi:adenine deaminase C-terminal domain-containing protein [Oceanobacillus bengalensis]|uniref:adenine deaminase n=1 Tax=Oceanobacillus bengalensis TaxID=1435466 RepID=A0A494YUM2_9BACI|nr:adenine deaminase C-terminal domain-containing protein [Oceanobacillus bengalensis]RKQ13828.1 adenine deaminase [Oceanobacillus bengalensis]
MFVNENYWRNRELRQHVKVIEGQEAPTLILKNSTYLNAYTKQWLQANIWIYHDRIVYVGEELPKNLHHTEVVDCKGKYIVPGYIEPHSHPFVLTNPEALASHAARFGTTTLINDNLMFHFLLNKRKAFSIMEDFNNLPSSMYWWARFDSQTALQAEEESFNTEDVLSWINHPSVVQGGELTSWPSLLSGDDRLLYWIGETKRRGKPIEGHLPGASEKTLTKMKLLGVSVDHESINGEEVLRRLRLGYHVRLRHSSIRPDLPNLIDEILALDLKTFDNLTLTMDGATPTFTEEGLINVCIDIAIKKGIPIEDAYLMGSYNCARQLHLDEQLGSIAPGRIAHINILESKDNPHPKSVLAKGKWVVREGEFKELPTTIDWEKYDINPLKLGWDLQEKDLQFSMPMGLEMVNNVIVKPYSINTDVSVQELPESKDEAFLLLIDRNGKWRVNTTIKGFTKGLGAIATSFSSSGDLIFIGKSKKDILLSWQRLKEIGGGIVLAHQGEVLMDIPLKLGGMMSTENLPNIIMKEKQLKKYLKAFGYVYDDPIYNILFLSATHLPYIRITQQGIIDIKNREVLFPATMC